MRRAWPGGESWADSHTDPLMPRVFATLFLLLAASGACGAPGSDAVFTKGNPKLAAAVKDTATPLPPPRPAAARILTRPYPGLYRREGDDSRFQPCGTDRPLVIFGPFEARAFLHERFRYASVWQGQNMFGVLQGAIVTDTIRSASDTGRGRIQTRFFITAVDSLRTWQSRDCGGMRVK